MLEKVQPVVVGELPVKSVLLGAALESFAFLADFRFAHPYRFQPGSWPFESGSVRGSGEKG